MEKKYIPDICKFCGSNGVDIVEVDQQWNEMVYAVRCECCFAEGPHCVSEEMAARMWGLAPVTAKAEIRRE